MFKRAISTALLCCFLAGCNDPNAARKESTEKSLKSLEEKIESQNNEIKSLMLNIGTLADRTRLDQKRITKLESGYEILLDPNEPDNGFQTIKTNIGYLTVSISSITPYSNGTKMTLLIGNPTTADIAELTATISWETADQTKDNSKYESNIFNIRERLNARKFTKTTINLKNIPPQDLAYVHIREASAKQIYLNK